MIIIKNGCLVDPKNNIDEICTLVIKDDKVFDVIKGRFKDSELEDKIKSIVGVKEADLEVIDAENKYVFPGIIDLHVHLREPGFEHKETIKTGSMAAARGGITTICPMPNTKPAIDSPQMVKWLMDKAKEESPVNIIPVGAVTKGQEGLEVTDIAGMVKAGALAISEDGKSVMDSAVYAKAMEIAAKEGIVVLAHCEDKNLVRGGVANAGAFADSIGVKGITNQVEDIIAARDILLAKETGAKLHLCHCSTKDSVEMVRLANEDGIKVTAEVCPHHFILTTEDIPGDDANFKMNPPLREKEDVESLKEGLYSGIMSCISTDHAPHSTEEKALGFAKAPFGITGLETSFALSYTNLVKNGKMSFSELIKRMSLNPANVLGIDKGHLGKGAAADLVIADIDTEYTINAEDFMSMGKNTPFNNVKVYGIIDKTFVSGKVVYSR